MCNTRYAQAICTCTNTAYKSRSVITVLRLCPAIKDGNIIDKIFMITVNTEIKMAYGCHMANFFRRHADKTVIPLIVLDVGLK